MRTFDDPDNQQPSTTALRICCMALLLVASAIAGCQKVVQSVLPKSTWHEKFHWKAEDYFDDPQVIALCKAIEANDLSQIDRLVAAGANVNAQGKGKMTPLLWAFPDNKLDRFKRLLEHGADPNVIVTSDFGTRSAIGAGTSVTHMATLTSFPGYFDVVFDHGGDPNLAIAQGLGSGNTALFCAIKSRAPNKERMIRKLVEKGADLNHVNAGYSSAPMEAVGWFGQYGIALLLLEAGADYRIYQWESNSRLVHIVVAEGERTARTSTWSPQQKADYEALSRWLENHGESLDEAREDRKRWRSWLKNPHVYHRNMLAEVAARKEREKQDVNHADHVEKAEE